MAEPIPEASGARIAASDVIPMFPTLVWKLQLEREFHEAVDAKILAAIVTMRRGELGPGQGWQSEHTLHEREELRELVASIRQAATTDLPFKVSHSAIVILKSPVLQCVKCPEYLIEDGVLELQLTSGPRGGGHGAASRDHAHGCGTRSQPNSALRSEKERSLLGQLITLDYNHAVRYYVS